MQEQPPETAADVAAEAMATTAALDVVPPAEQATRLEQAHAVLVQLLAGTDAPAG